ncbi:claudin-34 [Loxodonta africana]|uniref:claudin-34 n=1 Tax=Loxodonta africana TaxID=9785 RepID=UPI0030CFF49A
MILLVNSANCQVAGFAAATIGWLLSTTSMGLVEWRLWHISHAPPLLSSLVCVGMWRVCIHYHDSNKAIFCYHYTYHDTFLPLDICVSQNLLLVATILGLLGKACIIFAIRNLYMGILRKTATCNPFIASGILYLSASVCISVAVIWNYHSVRNEQGIHFPSSFYVPFKPDTQEIGSAFLVAALAAFLMLLSGFIFLSYRVPLDSQVHPEIAEI